MNVLDPDTGKQCRNLRTGFNKKPFAEPRSRRRCWTDVRHRLLKSGPFVRVRLIS
ncbi:hypothetical protein SALBM217S_07165 [Streptomyces griseoloalbus]